MKKILLTCVAMIVPILLTAQQPVPVKPRMIISTDIGGTDPDDNQSMIHFLMYSNQFDTEGLISSPSYGNGSKRNILEMIDLYEKDLPKLKKYHKDYPSADALRKISKQGRHGAAPYHGFTQPTEGSNWIIRCAQQKSERPLWILVWGGLEDVAQALHDEPAIANNIRVYWIGGPNKKWGINAYAYIAQNFPNLWFIENNASYHGLFSDVDVPTVNTNYYNRYISGMGNMGADFKNYYGGRIKMGDTPSLLYLMDGDPTIATKESWGGSFEPYRRSARRIFHRNTTLADTVPVYAAVEFHFDGPVLAIPADSACFTMTVKAKIGEQKWPGYYLGNGKYAIRYAPKQAETLSYTITSPIKGFLTQKGEFVTNNDWPGTPNANDYQLGANWYSDRVDPAFFYGEKQGARTQLKWREAALADWAKRWSYLRKLSGSMVH